MPAFPFLDAVDARVGPARRLTVLIATLALACGAYLALASLALPAHAATGLTWKAVSAGEHNTCAIKSDDSIACWGDNTYSELNAPSGSFKALAAGGTHTCAIRTDDSLACWGDNSFDQAGAHAGSFKAVSAKNATTCAIRTDDSLDCWGYDFFGQATAPAGGFKAVGVGYLHTCGVRSDDSLACWGFNEEGQTNPPAGSFKAVGAGVWHSCAIRTDASLACWGEDAWGQASPPAGSFKSLAVGKHHACAIRSDDSLLCWGNDDFGQTDVPVAPYDFAGFFKPVDNKDASGSYVLNKTKAGSAVPVKFSLHGDQGLAIFASGYPKSGTIACDPTAEVNGVEQTVSAGGSSLSYDAPADQYTYVWKTDPAWAGTCRQLVVKLRDGTIHRASFMFTK